MVSLFNVMKLYNREQIEIVKKLTVPVQDMHLHGDKDSKHNNDRIWRLSNVKIVQNFIMELTA